MLEKGFLSLLHPGAAQGREGKVHQGFFSPNSEVPLLPVVLQPSLVSGLI